MSQQPPPQLSPSALFEDQARLDAMRLQVYNRILANVHQKIRHTSTLPNSPQMTYYDVPEWQPGCPRFDVKDCILYVIWNLRNSGFKVLYVSPNRMVVSWKEQSTHYYQEESPIRRAMLAASQQSAPPPPMQKSSDKPEKKKAATYRPAAEGVAGMLAQGNPTRKPGSTITFI